MKTLFAFLVVGCLWGQPTSSTTLNFRGVEAGYYPYGQRITYTGTLNSATFGTSTNFGCNYDTSTPGEIWWRLGTYVTSTSVLAASDTPYTGCTGAGMTINGTFYPLTPSLFLSRRGVFSSNYPTGASPPANCLTTGLTNPRSFGFYSDCPDPNRQPSGSFTLPASCGTWTDVSGISLRVLTLASRVHYSGITPFNYDLTLFAGHNGIYRVSDCVQVIAYRSDNNNNGNCWFELAPGYQNTMTCLQGTIPTYGGTSDVAFRYTLPDLSTCGAFPCLMPAGVSLLQVSGSNAQGNAYNNATKGGTSGATTDGWTVWIERYIPSLVNVNDLKLCAARLTVPVGQVQKICTNNVDSITGFPLGNDYDYIQLAPSLDADGRRRIVMASSAPESMTIWSFAPNDTEIRYDGQGPIRSDTLANTQFKPYCPFDNSANWCLATPHGTLVSMGGHTSFVGDGNDGAVSAPWVLNYRLSAQGPGGGTAQKDILAWQEDGGGGGPAGFGGGYIGCAQASPICVFTNYRDYNAVSGKSGYNWVWPSANCTAGACTATTQDPHLLTTGDQIYVGINTVGIPAGSKPTITVTGANTYTFTSGTVTGSGTGGAIQVQTLQDGQANGIVMATRFFGPLGAQFVNLTTHRNCNFVYDDFPFTSISYDGSTFVYSTNNCLVGLGATIIGSTGLGSPRAFDQLTGPATAVSVTPAATTLTFNFLAPDAGTSCTATVSTRRDLTSASTATVASGVHRSITVTGLTTATPYFWQVKCGTPEARGVVVTK